MSKSKIFQKPKSWFRSYAVVLISVAIAAVAFLSYKPSAQSKIGRKVFPCGDHLWHLNDSPGPIPGTKLRRMSANDIPAMKILHNLLFPIKYSDEFYRRMAWNTCSSVLLVNATSQELEIIAFSTGRLSDLTPGSITGYISTLGVNPKFRRQGLGRFVVNALTNVFREDFHCDVVDLHVKSDNYPAKKLYESCNFQVMEFLENYYELPGSDANAYHMAKNVKQKWLSSVLTDAFEYFHYPWA